MSRASATLELPGNLGILPVVGTGTTQADAIAELKAKLALQIGTVTKVSVSDDVALTGYTTSSDTAGRDAKLVLSKGSGATKKTVAVTIRMVGSSFASPTVDGQLDISNTDLIAFAAAYKDGTGVGGYSLIRGEYVN